MNFEDLEVWKEAMLLVTAVYTATKAFPEEEKFGLTNQMRRASVSIPSNIAEGHGRRTKVDFARFLRTSLGSCSELKTQALIAQNLGYLDNLTSQELLNKCLLIQKMLRGFIKTLQP